MIAAAVEKKYFTEVMAALHENGVSLSRQSPIVIAVATDFAKALHQRYRRSTPAGGFAYAKFFSTYSPYDTARQYIEKFRRLEQGGEAQ